MSQAGIYQILNLTNQKSYIGSSECIRKRIYHHKRQLKSNTHGNQHLQNAWNKVGGRNFIFRTIEAIDLEEKSNQKLLEERENYWIDYYDSTNPLKGYNKQKAERGTFTKEWKLRRKESLSKFQTKEYFLNLKLLSDLSSEDKELIINNLLKYTQDKKSVSLNRIQNGLQITISNPNINFEKIVYIQLKPLQIINKEEYIELAKPEKIYQIKQSTNNIIKIYNQVQEVLNEYPQIKRKPLERLLYSKTTNFSSVNNMIFVLESNYDSSKVYSVRQRKSIEQINSNGEVIKIYGSVKQLLKENPTLKQTTLMTVLSDNSPSTMYPFKYKNTESKELRQSIKSEPSIILELNQDNQPIKEFIGLKSVLKEYPEITSKGLQKVLYENRKSTKGHYFILKRNFPTN